MIHNQKTPKGSTAGALSSLDWKKIGIGAVLAIVGGLSAFVADSFLPVLTAEGSLPALLIASTVPILLNTLRKLLTDTR